MCIFAIGSFFRLFSSTPGSGSCNTMAVYCAWYCARVEKSASILFSEVFWLFVIFGFGSGVGVRRDIWHRRVHLRSAGLKV